MNNLEKNYILLELTYKNSFNNKNIFPNKWYEIKDYNIKIQILNEAIKNNILIIETEKYQIYSNNHYKHINKYHEN